MRWTPSLSVSRLRVRRADSGTMTISARPMKPRPRAALRADEVCRSRSASPTGRAMPNVSRDPVGSGVVATIQSGSTVVPAALPGLIALVPRAWSRLLSAALAV